MPGAPEVALGIFSHVSAILSATVEFVFFPELHSLVVTQIVTHITYVSIAGASSKVPDTHGILMHIYGVRAVFLENDGGTHGINKVASLHLLSIVNLGPLITICCIFIRERRR